MTCHITTIQKLFGNNIKPSRVKELPSLEDAQTKVLNVFKAKKKNKPSNNTRIIE